MTAKPKLNPFRARLSLQVDGVHRRYFEDNEWLKASEYARGHFAGRNWSVVRQEETTPCWAF